MLLLMVFYIILGALMDELSMILLTVGPVFKLVVALGFDPIWFGVMLVTVCEIGMIVPPVASTSSCCRCGRAPARDHRARHLALRGSGLHPPARTLPRAGARDLAAVADALDGFTRALAANCSFPSRGRRECESRQ